MGLCADRSDDELVDAFINGDGKAFSAIVERHRRRLTYVARKYVSNEDEAQDVVQDALFKASRTLHTYRRDAALTTWLHRLVMNCGYDYRNHRSNRENHSLEGGIEADRNWLLSHEPAISAEQRLIIEEAFKLLRPDQREALFLTDVAGYPVNDVAERQGVKPGTIKSRRARAKEVLRAAIA